MELYIRYIFILFLFGFTRIYPFQPAERAPVPCAEGSGPESFDCGERDSIPILDFSSQEFSETGDFNFAYGHRREALSEKVTVNGNDDLEETIFGILHDNLGSEVMRNAPYQNLEINFLVSRKGKVEHLYLTNELFWYFEEPGFGRQADMLNFADPDEIEMAKNLFDFMSPEEIQIIKDLVSRQSWKSGKCNGKRVDTVVILRLNPKKM